MRRSGAAAALLALVVLAGCGGPSYDPAETVDVSGTVTIDGEKLGDVEVFFVPNGSEERASNNFAITAADGTFELPGILPGEYEVRVDRMVNGGPDPGLSKYRENSPLKAEVSETNTTFNFAVTRQE